MRQGGPAHGTVTKLYTKLSQGVVVIEGRHGLLEMGGGGGVIAV